MSVIRLVLCSFYAVFVTVLSTVTLHLSSLGLAKVALLAQPFSKDFPFIKDLVELSHSFTSFTFTHVLLFAVVIGLLATSSKVSETQRPAPVYSTKKHN
ncbi:hypothetical protein SAMD00019534_075070 [Acytostelium subglobosum LB1]|uniref:hypothetical protein n=1 Tax=Acytostelium subglobosum LB1 TaxID=1410327 RepID=UPI0006447D1F|nr:hypothetical protein SAMD00019534_075070 [Acytostelium subglobosum LB1]GAM24332.1 hypothetical protein SAMD00019534_075070 [Acytostelium subglobosum LB1]|eukprot:XP_012752658.1 hypothetical protein SAMD00019534_075070 [Acytostelium subglobosum LB1]